MNRLAGVTFTGTDEAVNGNVVGYLTYVTGIVDKIQYKVGYSAERPVNERFTLYIDNHIVNLSDYVSADDLERMNACYFDKQVTGRNLSFLTIQLKNCYELCV